jgi:hypothetical protein
VLTAVPQYPRMRASITTIRAVSCSCIPTSQKHKCSMALEIAESEAQIFEYTRLKTSKVTMSYPACPLSVSKCFQVSLMDVSTIPCFCVCFRGSPVPVLLSRFLYVLLQFCSELARLRWPVNSFFFCDPLVDAAVLFQNFTIETRSRGAPDAKNPLN